MNAIDPRLQLKWFMLTDRHNKQRLITPLPEAAGQGVPGMLRYKDADGVAGFVDQMWFRDHSRRVRAEELGSMLPVMSLNESQRHFEPLVTAAAALKAASNAQGQAARGQAMKQAKPAAKTLKGRSGKGNGRGGSAKAATRSKPKTEATAPTVVVRPKRVLERP